MQPRKLEHARRVAPLRRRRAFVVIALDRLDQLLQFYITAEDAEHERLLAPAAAAAFAALEHALGAEASS